MGERRRNDSGNLIPDRVAKAFSVAYGEPDPGRGLEMLQALLGRGTPSKSSGRFSDMEKFSRCE